MENTGKGVMFNAYPDSIGGNLSCIIQILNSPELLDAFSKFYILPTFFKSDLDRGFSIISYELNDTLVKKEDIDALNDLSIEMKFDFVLNHLSVNSPQFLDILKNGDSSDYMDFFINWNDFWDSQGILNEEGVVIPFKEHLDKLFMRKSGLPILKVLFPDGSYHPYWNTFYQKVSYSHIGLIDVEKITSLHKNDAYHIMQLINNAIDNNLPLDEINFGAFQQFKENIIAFVKSRPAYLGQMDLNANSPQVWQFYQDVMQKLANFNCKILRLDAFAYLHKEVGKSNFFNKPGTWEYLSKIKEMAFPLHLELLPEIHAEYGLHLHDEVANEGFMIYDFFLPGLIIHTLETKNGQALINWANEVIEKGFKTVNMLGCHDGIPVLDLKGKEVNGIYNEGLLSDGEIEHLLNLIISRGGKVKNLYGPDGKKVSYYQVNATYYSALGENDDKMLLARALQLFMPGIPQIWYLDLFLGKNDYDAVLKAGPDGHKEINRTNLSLDQVKDALRNKCVQNQLSLIKIRNRASAFYGKPKFYCEKQKEITIIWENNDALAKLEVNLEELKLKVIVSENNQTTQVIIS